MNIYLFGSTNPVSVELRSQLAPHQLFIISSSESQYCIQQNLLFQPNSSLIRAIASHPPDIIISTVPIYIFQPFFTNYLIDIIKDISHLRIIVISSSSVITKRYSPHPYDIGIVAKLQTSEDLLSEAAIHFKLDIIVVRPTLIFNPRRKQGLHPLTFHNSILSFPVLAVPRSSLRSYRQPIQADQLAFVISILIDLPRFRGSCCSLNIGGNYILNLPDVISYYSAGFKHFFIPLPNSIFILLSLLLLPFSSRLSSYFFHLPIPFIGFPTISEFACSPARHLSTLKYAPNV